ncbi:MAG: helix-turn-helix transcriptional regulator [Lachnospiraceae bacterium]|nr:helix-turn-helix transcriptional regulator [Lachnospiraceae bacterium]
MGIGTKIKEARTNKGLTQEQAAETLLVSRQTVSNWENEKSLPDIVSVIKMSELYEISLDGLLKGDTTMIKKLENDVKAMNTEKKIIKFAFICIAIGAVILALSQFFEGNPIIDFLSGATPWVLLGLSFLFAILHLDKEEKAE